MDREDTVMTKPTVTCDNTIDVHLADGNKVRILQKNVDFLPMKSKKFAKIFLKEIADKKVTHSIQRAHDDMITGFVMNSLLYCQFEERNEMSKQLLRLLTLQK